MNQDDLYAMISQMRRTEGDLSDMMSQMRRTKEEISSMLGDMIRIKNEIIEGVSQISNGNQNVDEVSALRQELAETRAMLSQVLQFMFQQQSMVQSQPQSSVADIFNDSTQGLKR